MYFRLNLSETFAMLLLMQQSAGASTLQNKKDVLEFVKNEISKTATLSQSQNLCNAPDEIQTRQRDFSYQNPQDFDFTVDIACAAPNSQVFPSYNTFLINSKGTSPAGNGRSFRVANASVDAFYASIDHQVYINTSVGLITASFYQTNLGKTGIDVAIYETSDTGAICHDYLDKDGPPDFGAWGSMSCQKQNFATFYYFDASKNLSISYRGLSLLLDFYNFEYDVNRIDGVVAHDFIDRSIDHAQWEKNEREAKESFEKNWQTATIFAQSKLNCQLPDKMLLEVHRRHKALLWSTSEVTFACGDDNTLTDPFVKGKYLNISVTQNDYTWTREGEVFYREGERFEFFKDPWGYYFFEGPGGQMNLTISRDLFGNFGGIWASFMDRHGNYYCADTFLYFNDSGVSQADKIDPLSSLPDCQEFDIMHWDGKSNLLEIYFNSMVIRFDYNSIEDIIADISD